MADKKSYLEMSDEELMATPMQEDDAAGADSNVPATEDKEEGDPANADDAQSDGLDDAGQAAEGDAAADKGEATDDEDDTDPKSKEGDPAVDKADPEAADAEGVKAGEKDSAAVEGGEGKEKPADKDPAEKADPATPPVPPVDYQAEYNRLVAPFKANGKDVQVKDVDDAIALMQMGANYQKKMAALKPHLKLLKMLERNQITGESDVSYLIDLHKKNPAAINKLIKDSGVDPLQIDPDKAGDYQPTSYKVDDREMALDTALDAIQETPTYNRTLEILGTKWDGDSKRVIAESPQLVKVINDHVQSGIYDIIATEVERERMFGRLSGLSDINAYQQVGDAIQARGGFQALIDKKSAAPTEPVIVQPKLKTAQDDKLRDKKRAAAPSGPSAPAKAAQEFNPLSLSDDAFEKMLDERFK